MRLIDADVLKQHIDKLPALPDGNFAGNHSALKALINMQPTIDAESKWIPVSEGLPEDGEICLVCGKNGGMYVARIDRHGFWKRTGTGKFLTPIAWQPLPKPYEVEK